MNREGMANKALLLIVSLAAATTAAGCTVDPYCTTCGDDGVPDSGTPDSGDSGMADVVVADVVTDTGLDDAGNDGCLVDELCNNFDDDCDGMIDEGIDLMTNVDHCGACNTPCAPPHAFAVCEGGVCGQGECDVEWYDIDPMIFGCEYRCSNPEGLTTDVICDLRDDDCDGMIDEDVLLDTDPTNCGSCGRVCRFAHAGATCVMGACELGDCDAGFYDIDGRRTNGCEYACMPASPPDEICDGLDNDCDGVADEGNPGGGLACGIETGECSLGTTSCDAGRIICMGATRPTTELCNGLDDDCDGTPDEGNPEGGRLCGSAIGTCEQGRESCMGGALVCMGGVGPVAEICDGLDNDCDGTIDDGNPGGGGTCGNDTGECVFGTRTCVGGTLVCMGGTGPVAERCNNRDDDCDGTIDEGNPDGGALCGTDVGLCSPGAQQCMGGALVCVGSVGPQPELCDGLDNDCDGAIDDGNPGGGGTCGIDTGACSFGTQICAGGTLTCSGGIGPATEICNSTDDDCDGMTDETFNLSSDVRNCGMCGRVCSFAFATSACTAGTCTLGTCLPGHIDRDGNPANGCEYACEVRGAEVCNGIDDDCDGVVDDGVVAPTNFCNPNGVCAGTSATCGGTMGWVCVYPATYQPSESRCDGLDNDCDGSVDEPFPLRGTSCSNGTGLCRRTGTYVCNMGGDAVTCNAPPAGTPQSEACDNIDNDCDGLVDERVVDDPATAWRDGVDINAISTVVVNRATGSTPSTMRVMQYEASRADATATGSGSAAVIACSKPNVVPWTNVSWDEANAACAALNPSGTVPGAGEVGWRLCGAEDWEAACEGPSGTCNWSYSSSCTTSQPLVCNGNEHDCNPASAGDQDCLYTTGSPTFPGCRTVWSGGSVFDMSGNAREWTSTVRGAGVYELRGGAYTNIEPGRACDFDFAVAETTFRHPNTGFRCCYY